MTRAQARPAEHYIHAGGGVIVVPARVCAYLNRYAGLDTFRRTNVGIDAEVDALLVAFHIAENAWLKSVTGTPTAAPPELPASSEWLSTTIVAALLGMTDRGVRTAIAAGRLQAESVAGRYRISREALNHFRQGRKQLPKETP
ncbi:helix-turn-helix domain-containing protein [Cryobacterium sp. TmT2-59]|uniref:helix-turn-helix domain-containing protein n=1 Tax=Cryobacterium sp. TmT2-59 TaxID=1259264 RepID=UPI00141AB2F8|nr:helix-turn-helix domain-containing protein [Cryobacterium sp. TmT2-59]